MSDSVVHVLPRLQGGGSIAALLDLLAASPGGAEAPRHEVISLGPVAPGTVQRIERHGAAVWQVSPTGNEVRQRLAEASIVHLNYWNTPSLNELLSGELAPMRLAVWLHVNGFAPPQRVPRWLVEGASAFVATTPVTEPALRERGVTAPIELIEPGFDPEVAASIDALAGAAGGRKQGYPLTVGSLGSLDSSKVHPRIAGLLAAAIAGFDARAEIYGAGDSTAAIQREAVRLGAGDRIQVHGHEPNVARRLAGFDLSAYPLAEGTPAAAELAVREAMRSGLPVVAIDRGGLGAIIRDGETGIVAADEAGFVAGVRRLLGDPQERRRLGAAARTTELARPVAGALWAGLYRRLLDEPKAEWRPPREPVTGAAGFRSASGALRPWFRLGTEGEGAEAEAALAAADAAAGLAGPVIARSGGGILESALSAPDDPHLHLWAGLQLADQGRPALAAAELTKASKLGLGDRARPALDLAQRRTRDGLGWLGEGAVVYLGSSVTVQRSGYRPALHAALEAEAPGLGRMVNAGVSELGSLAAVFMADQLVLAHRPTACFIELAFMDVAGATPPELAEPAAEAIVRRLRAHACEPCFLLIPFGGGSTSRNPELVDVHRRVAARLGVRCVDLEDAVEQEDRKADAVHLTDDGGLRVGNLIAEHLRAMPAPAAADSILGHELAPYLFHPRLVPATTADLSDPPAGSAGYLRLVTPYVVAAPGNPFRPRPGGTVWGAVAAVGPASGGIVVRGAGRGGQAEAEEAHTLWNQWSTHEHLAAVVFDAPRIADRGFELEASEVEVGRSRTEGLAPDGLPIGQDLRVISWMVTDDR